MRSISIIGSAILLSTTIAFAGQLNAAKSHELHLRFAPIPGPIPQSVDEALQRWPREVREHGRLSKAEPPPRPPRSQELGEHQIRIEAVDARGNLRYFQHLPDPRVIRAEFPPEGQTSGEITSHIIVTDAADFVMPIPTNEAGKPPITELRIYQRAPQGHDYELELIGTVNVR